MVIEMNSTNPGSIESLSTTVEPKAVSIIRVKASGVPARCPVCASGLMMLNMQCIACETLHHADCWEYNRGCGRYGCVNVPPQEKEPATERTAGEQLDISDELPPDALPPRRFNPWAMLTFGLLFFYVLQEVGDNTALQRWRTKRLFTSDSRTHRTPPRNNYVIADDDTTPSRWQAPSLQRRLEPRWKRGAWQPLPAEPREIWRQRPIRQENSCTGYKNTQEEKKIRFRFEPSH